MNNVEVKSDNIVGETKRDYFGRFARSSARLAGRPLSFFLAVSVVIVWLCSGPVFGFSDSWQLVINTGTTIVTFLMVFVIQNAQNRDGQAIQLKLDELLRSIKGAHTALLDIEKLSEEELDTLRNKYEKLASNARAALQKGQTDVDCPEVCVSSESENDPKVETKSVATDIR